MGFYYSDDELAHHGIKGQRWGVRRFQNRNGTRTAAGKARAKVTSDQTEKKGLTDQQKRAIKIGAAVVGASLVAAGGVYLYKTGKIQAVGNTFIKREAGARGLPDSPTSDYTSRIAEIAKVRNITKVEGDYLQLSDEQKGKIISSINSEDGKHNCQACTAAFDLFRKTGDVFHIRSDVDTVGWGNEEFMRKVYKDFTGFKKIENSTSCKDFTDKIAKEVGDGYGRITVSGHAMSFYSQGGKIRIVESQTKHDFSPESLDLSPIGKLFDWSSVEYARTDNLEFSDNGIEFLGRLTQRKKTE